MMQTGPTTLFGDRFGGGESTLTLNFQGNMITGTATGISVANDGPVHQICINCPG
jgi:hypothetical protein